MCIKKQNIFIIILIIIGIVSIFLLERKEKNFFSGNLATNYNSNSIYISTPKDLVSFAESVNQGKKYVGIHVMLENDIDMSGVSDFIPIGIWREGNYFYGTFDGRGYTIRNLNIDTDLGNKNNGLFGTLGSEGTVCNLNMENCYIKGSACGAICSIAENEHSRIYNCSINNCLIDAEYTDIIGGQYVGKLENNSINSSENIDVLNNNLQNLSARCNGIAMNRWIEQDGQIVLSPNETEKKLNAYVHIQSSSYTGNIESYYSEEEQIYYIILPNNKFEGKAFLEVEDNNGKKVKYSVDLSGEGGEEIELLFLEDKIILSENNEINSDKNSQSYTIKICYTENTACIFVNTKKKWVMDYLKFSKKNAVPGYIEVLNEDGTVNYKGGLERIQGRGNNSWNLAPKKGFNLELLDNANLLDMGVETHFALLPGYRDSSLVTYKIVQDLCKEIETEFAPEYRFVNFYLDGEYQGMYVLAEKMNVGYNRIDINTENKDVTGSYLLELDNLFYADEPNVFETKYGNMYTVKYPFVMKENQITYCKEFLNQFERAARSENGYNEEGFYYTDYLDLDSAAQFWLYCEISGEFSLNGSVYFYKESDNYGDGKLHVLYPWDVEHSFANESWMTEDIMINMNADKACGLWYFLYSHEDFKEAVYRNWIDVYRPAMEKLLNDNIGENPEGISSLSFYKDKYETSFYYNELLWGENQNIGVKMALVKRFLEGRIPYLDEALKN